ncbi:TPA: HNH endonuclease [Pseudomonas aeruginosa]|nr:HNH endonuclease [Pseudomonas aeruginosa]HEJ2068537.1 HNH endonuclease [Pseudomonas aeruginosa]HEJ4469359.1 HNH endonuclease [Pseudomonas aeruginosa]HEJ5099296.1 HNH endonuclease [Pseudomonas aeruginosa]HEJ5111246.1 HNH endonuclease [Pseudomonas aeruginosa]
MAQASAIQTVNPDSWRSGKNSTQRGYGYRWQQARARFLAKHPLCRSCSEAGDVVEATEVDHIIAHRGDQALFWDESNWQPLCKPCHSAKTQEEMRSS